MGLFLPLFFYVRSCAFCVWSCMCVCVRATFFRRVAWVASFSSLRTKAPIRLVRRSCLGTDFFLFPFHSPLCIWSLAVTKKIGPKGVAWQRQAPSCCGPHAFCRFSLFLACRPLMPPAVPLGARRCCAQKGTKRDASRRRKNAQGDKTPKHTKDQWGLGPWPPLAKEGPERRSYLSGKRAPARDAGARPAAHVSLLCTFSVFPRCLPDRGA